MDKTPGEGNVAGRNDGGAAGPSPRVGGENDGGLPDDGGAIDPSQDTAESDNFNRDDFIFFLADQAIAFDGKCS